MKKLTARSTKPEKATPQRQRPKRKRPIRHSRKSRPLHRRFLLHPGTVFALFCIGVLIVGLTASSKAADYNVTALVPAAALLEPAIITSPADSAKLSSSPLEVQGICPANSYVKLLRNGYFSGVANCSSNNSFQIVTDLSIGANQLIAQDYNVTNAAGPASSPITIYYAAPTLSDQAASVGMPPLEAANSPSGVYNYSSDNAGFGPLLLTADYTYQSFQADQRYHWGMNLAGGTPPYVVAIQWGDNTSSSLVFKTDPTFDIEHVYQRAGNYSIIVDSVDAKGEKVVLQLSTVIKPAGAISTLGGIASPTTKSGSSGGFNVIPELHRWLWLIWPAYGTVLLMTISFWLGERQEYQHLFRKKRFRT